MIQPHIALVTAKAARDLDDDLAPLTAALRELAAHVHVVDWDDAEANWQDFDLAILRSPWDYTQRRDEFLQWAQRIAAQTCLLNPLDVIRWNIDKRYLKVLDNSGVPIVPSRFCETGENAAMVLDAFLAEHPACSEIVVKPTLGAGSRDAERHGRQDRSIAIEHMQRLLKSGRTPLLQPYLDRVDEYGETALIFIDGAFSHAIRKGPLLRRGEGSTHALFAPEHITPREPSAEEIAVAHKAVAAIPFGQPLLYARIDLVLDQDGVPCLLELELAEPSLFFDHAPSSAGSFADAILRRFNVANA